MGSDFLLKIIYGPPCSGKTTYVKENIKEGDIVIDLDYIKHALTYKGYHDDLKDDEFGYLWGIRNHLISNPKDNITTWLITTQEVTEDLEHYNEIELIEIKKSKEDIYRLIENDDSREDKEKWKRIVDDWFDNNESKQSYEKEVKTQMNKRYYSLYKEDKTVDIYIYGDITSWEWLESDVSSYTLSKELQELGDEIENINIYINSYGGEVAEGLAIYNALKRHKAKVTTYTDGFACSIASVIFAAGDERVMNDTSLLMIHNAWTRAAGDSKDLKKQAEDLEKITQASINAYMNIVNIEEEELKEMMDSDTWLNGDEALEMGFATKLVEVEEKEVATQSIRKQLLQRITEEPKKTPAAGSAVDKKEIEKIVQKKIKELEHKLLDSSKDKEPQEPEEENKPLNMMKALFNAKNKEED